MKCGPEIEVKFRLLPGQREELVARLGQPQRTLKQRDRYFDVPGRVLRLRQENGSWLLTRKDAHEITADGIKTRHEVERPITEAMSELLEDLLVWLGHPSLIEVAKERHEYERGGFLLCLDRIDGLSPGDFLEIESVGGDKEAMRRLWEDLGLDASQVEQRSYAAQLAQAKT